MPTPREMIVGVIRPIQHFPSRAHRRRVAARTTLPTGHDRVYCYHIRKTAGTSLGMAFLGLGGDASALYAELHKRGRWIDANGVLCVRSDRHLLAEGFYLMGSSHREAWNTALPPNTFRLTCLRDPVARVLSHYRMLLHFARTQPDRLPGSATSSTTSRGRTCSASSACSASTTTSTKPSSSSPGSSSSCTRSPSTTT